MVLYLTNTKTNEDIAQIQLSETIFSGQYGGVIKGNSFYLVQKTSQPIFLPTRADELGCTLYQKTEQQQKSCLIRKLDLSLYEKIPSYFFQDMEVVSKFEPYMPKSIDQILIEREAEQRMKEEAELVELTRQQEAERLSSTKEPWWKLKVCTNPWGMC